jgi:putative endonuclease
MVELSRQQVGAAGEELAAAELERQGMVILDRNWRCGAGEIDIVAMDCTEEAASSLVFCEVKCRTGLGYGAPLEAITYAKSRKLRQLAAEWLAAHDVAAKNVRIDAIGVTMLPNSEPQLTHIRGIDE